jgi:hypothetical protein
LRADTAQGGDGHSETDAATSGSYHQFDNTNTKHGRSSEC